MNKSLAKSAAAFIALFFVFFISGCGNATQNEATLPEPSYVSPTPAPNEPAQTLPTPLIPVAPAPHEPQPPELPSPEPQQSTVEYLFVTADKVNIRTGAGTDCKVAGKAEKHTLYAYLGESDGWYITQYKGQTRYISAKYCNIVSLPSSPNEKIERVIAEGARLLGTKYVYGATRYHDGEGHKLKGFTESEFDCSSLMQYIIYRGANVTLQVTTRTQILQGSEVEGEPERGDLLFFTNSSRYNKTGIERVGHVALYLGSGYILHTASDYAKIEKLTSARINYFIKARRIIT